MKIDRIAIACFKKDLFLLRPCVASIRFWYPEIPIVLLKDEIAGKFSTREIEENWNVTTYQTERSVFGWGWSKLAVLLSPKRERILFLDSDTVFLGPVLDVLERHSEDFVVTGILEDDKYAHTLRAHYLDVPAIEEFDPSYSYPGFAFNSGQMVITTGVISSDDLAPVVNLHEPISSKYPNVLKHADQGVLNYVVAKACADGKISVRYDDFWMWPGLPEAEEVDVRAIARHEGLPKIMHWAGIKPVDFRNYFRADILEFFNDFYYSRVSRGWWKRSFRTLGRLLIVKAKIMKYRVLSRPYT